VNDLLRIVKDERLGLITKGTDRSVELIDERIKGIIEAREWIRAYMDITCPTIEQLREWLYADPNQDDTL
jgi:hypothetical protein